MRFDRVVGDYRFIEAPRVSAHGALYFTDLVGGGVHKRSADGRMGQFLPARRWIGGLVFNHDGGFVCSGLGGLVHFNESTGIERPLLTAIEGEPVIAVNDIYADDHGSIYGGTVDFASIERRLAPARGVLFRLDPPDSVTVLCREVSVSNGIGLSPDRSRLYHSETSVGVWVYELDAGRHVTARRLFAELPDSDGLAVDAEGGVWVAALNSGKLIRFEPDGSAAQDFELPVLEAVSLTFAGDDMRDLYVAAGGDIYDALQRRAAIYVGRSPVAGQINPIARF
jgi:sugar lactone lactonase YvrE